MFGNISTFPLEPTDFPYTSVNDGGDADDVTEMIETIEVYIYCVCFAVGVPLNVISFVKLFGAYRKSQTTHKQQHAQINLLRLHLNVADLMTLFCFTTVQIGWMMTTEWLGGDLLCRVAKFFSTFVFYLTSFIIVCIAIDRAYGAFRLSTFRVSRRDYDRCKRMLVVAWVMATLTSLPQLYVFGVVSPPDNPEFRQCATKWMLAKSVIEKKQSDENIEQEYYNELLTELNNLKNWETAYNIFHLLFVFCLPVLIIFASYISVLCLLSAFSRQSNGVFKESKLKAVCCSLLFVPSKLMRQHSQELPSFNSVAFESEQSNKIRHVVFNHRKNDTVATELQSDEPVITVNPPSGESQRPAVDSTRRPSEESTDFNRVCLLRSSASHVNIGPMAMKTIARARQRTKRQAALILIAYLTFWTPYNVLAIVHIVVSRILDNTAPLVLGRALDFSMTSLPFLNSLIVVNAIVNPLIYGVFDSPRSFRHPFTYQR